MTDVVYKIVEHDGGWAYKLGDVFSETFPNRQAAEAAAKRVADEQREPGEDEAISWEDETGAWHDEAARGTDRPNVYVANTTSADRDAERPLGRGNPRPAPANYGKGAYERTTLRAGSTTQPRSEQVRSDPLLSLLLAAVGGLALGIMLRRKL